MSLRAPAADIFSAFVEPLKLARFWLSSSSGPLAVDTVVHWQFMVPGAEVDTTATILVPERKLAWRWSDRTTVEIELEEVDGGTTVTVSNAGFTGSCDDIVEVALNATEGFSLVLADLKTMLESGTSAHIVRDKARLIALRKRSGSALRKTVGGYIVKHRTVACIRRRGGPRPMKMTTSNTP